MGASRDGEKARRSPSHTETKPKAEPNGVSLCGMDPELSSSLVRTAFAVGASTIDPPQKLGQIEKKVPPPVSDRHRNMQVSLCGMNPHLSSEVVQTLYAVGASNILHPETLDRPQQGDAPNLVRNPSEQENDVRIVSIVEDLTQVAPKLVKRENILQVVKKREQQNRNASLSNKENALLDTDYDSLGEYPSDIDEFLDYARHVVEEQNTSYDSASFRDFESVLQESIQSHFRDDDDDDSMTSASTFSGYCRDSRSKKHLEENSLISNSSVRRIQGQIARKKQGAVRSVTFQYGTSESSNPSTRETATKESENESKTVTTVPSLTGAVKGPRSSLKSSKGRPSEYQASSKPTATDLSVTDFSGEIPTHVDDQGDSQDPDIDAIYAALKVAPHQKGIQTKAAASKKDRVADLPQSIITLNTAGKTGKQIMDEYKISIDDNSVISQSSFQPRSRVRKRRFRKKGAVVLTGIPDSHEDNIEQTVDDLAFMLARENHHGSDRLSKNLASVDSQELLKQLQQVSPELYNEVVARHEIEGGQTKEGLPEVTSNELKPSPSNQSPAEPPPPLTSVPMACSTPDKTYWADQSRGVDDDDEQECPIGCSSPPSESPDNGGIDNPTNESPNHQENSLHNLALASSIASPEANDRCDDVVHAKEAPVDFSFSGHGSYWDEALDVASDGTTSLFPEISIDDEDSPLSDGELRSMVEASNLPEGYDLDEMVDLFLAEKIDKVHWLMRERGEVLARKREVFKELLSSRGALHQEESSSVNPACQDHSARNIQRGRALIRKIQRKRKALHLARQQSGFGLERVDEQTDMSYPAVAGPDSTSRAEEEASFSAHAALDWLLPMRDHQSSSVDRSGATNPTLLQATRRSVQRARDKRKSVLRAQFLGRSSKKALHESMDESDHGSDDTIQTGSTASRFSSPPAPVVKPPAPQVVKLRFHKRRSENSYEALAENDNSFTDSDLKSGDILQMMAPPSPESPIGGYQLDDSKDFMDERTDDEVRNGALHLDFDEGGRAGAPLHVDTTDSYNDSFDEIILRPGNDGDDMVGKFSATRKISPTSIADFADDYAPTKQRNSDLAFVDDEEADPLFVDDEDGFINNSLVARPEEETTQVIEANFISYTQFEI